MNAVRTESATMQVPSFSASTAKRGATVAAISFGIVASF